MAKQQPHPFLLPLFLVLSVGVLPMMSHCRTVWNELSQIDTTDLDVYSSLDQTLAVLSSDRQKQVSDQLRSFTFTSDTPTSFYLPLHPRESLSRTVHKEYRSLVLSRLGRDSARVSSIVSRVTLAVGNVTRSELQPQPSSQLFRQEGLAVPVVSGISQGSGEYFSRIGVGSPAREFYMVLDTGSDINWLQCEPCTDCYQQTDAVFNPASSSSSRKVSCDSPFCDGLHVSACRSGQCLYQVSYGDGSFTVGDLVTETVSFGNSGKVNNVALGCGHDNEGLFEGAAGLLGLGGGLLSLTNQIKATAFSYCLVDRDSSASSSLEFNPTPVVGDSVSTPLVKNSNVDTFYYVALTGMSVGGSQVSIPPSLFQTDESGSGGVIVDSGTAITRLKTEAYNSLRDAFVKLTQNLKTAEGFALFDTCYDFSSLPQVRVPTVSFHFSGGKSLTLPAKNYLIPVDSSGTFCFAFAPTSSSLSIIGNVQQQGTRVTFDLANSVVGFTPNKC